MDKHPCTEASEALDASPSPNPRLDPLFDLIGHEEANWLLDAVHAWWEENDPEGDRYEYADNRRLALVGDEASQAVYDEMALEGCCGSMDVALGPSPAGRTYLFGFNYGH